MNAGQLVPEGAIERIVELLSQKVGIAAGKIQPIAEILVNEVSMRGWVQASVVVFVFGGLIVAVWGLIGLGVCRSRRIRADMQAKLEILLENYDSERRECTKEIRQCDADIRLVSPVGWLCTGVLFTVMCLVLLGPVGRIASPTYTLVKEMLALG